MQAGKCITLKSFNVCKKTSYTGRNPPVTIVVHATDVPKQTVPSNYHIRIPQPTSSSLYRLMSRQGEGENERAGTHTMTSSYARSYSENSIGVTSGPSKKIKLLKT